MRMNVMNKASYRRTVTLVIALGLIGMTLGVGAATAQEGAEIEITDVTDAQTSEATVEESVAEESSQTVDDDQETVESEESVTGTGTGTADLVDFDDEFATGDPVDDLSEDDFLSGGLFE